ncbi:MAG: enoyl-CoA hydratase-related protein [Acidobacteria bacterium]|nr:enoyl-CoA hydratase-related protein [Acidobacteriota bacterium]
MADDTTLIIEDRGPARIITINRPQVLNALNAAVITALSEAFHALAAEKHVRGVVLTGAGEKAFVAGADIAAMRDLNPEQALAFARRGHAVGDLIASTKVPVIAAVNGFALGGGCEIALACDFIYASTRARFGQPEVKLGVIPGFGGTQRLLRRVGLGRAIELCVTGEMITADEALRIGLANKVCEPEALLQEAVACVDTIATMGPLAVAEAKRVIHAGASLPLAAANQLEAQAFADLFTSRDQSEGMSAFVEKRAASFSGE